MEIIKKKNTQSRVHFHHQKRDFDGQRSVWSEVSTAVGAFGAESRGREEISRPPLVHSHTFSSIYNKITIFPRFIYVFGTN